MKTPWRAKAVLGDVEATPSDPPSNTLTAGSSHTDRRPSSTVPPATASAVVVTEHVEPTLDEAVAMQGTV